MRVALGLLFAVAAGCTAGPTAPPRTKSAYDYPMPSSAEWAVFRARCVGCHSRPPFPAGIDLRAPGRVARDQLALLQRGLAEGLAPAYVGLTDDERKALAGFAAMNGAPWQEIVPPAVVRWSLTQDLGSWPVGAEASGIGAPGFGSIIEDGYREGWDGPSAWTVADVAGKRVLRLFQARRPASGGQPSSYWTPHLAHHDKLRRVRVIGEVRQGRWSSVVVGARQLLETRAAREYVRLQIDRDAVSLRSTPTTQETWPWYQDPERALVALAGPLDRSGFYLPSSEWLRFEIEAEVTAAGALYRARVWREIGSLLADFAALDPRLPPHAALGGVAFHKYALSGSPTLWRDVVITGWTQTDAKKEDLCERDSDSIAH